ncbi:hypothetical protein ACHAXA_000605 [Cyclostephanos tholiformis]|uniref:PNPLA domain-containing protein n=1 Tax=Cyclostephanos tholiformis TaxID=382380 RepID=A0ABD3SQA4_9STRA
MRSDSMGKWRELYLPRIAGYRKSVPYNFLFFYSFWTMQRIPPTARSSVPRKQIASSSTAWSPTSTSHHRRVRRRRPPPTPPPPPSFSSFSSSSSSSPSSSSSSSSSSVPSYGFSGAGFLGCYHVGVASCLRKHGHLPIPSDAIDGGGCGGGGMHPRPRLTGVSAGSMIAAAISVGVIPDPDGMEVVLEASRKTREMSRMSLDALTPGLSLIDAVEGPLRNAMARALGGRCDDGGMIRDVDPELFGRRVPEGHLRIGLTHGGGLWTMNRERFRDSYRYVESFRDAEDVISCCVLSSYIPGFTGPLNATDNVLPTFLRVLMGGRGDGVNGTNGVGGVAMEGSFENDASVRAGLILNEMTNLGLVRHGKTGLPVSGMDSLWGAGAVDNEGSAYETNVIRADEQSTIYWDGGIVDVFPIIDENTVVVTPLNGLFDPNPSICPQMPGEEFFAGNNGVCSDSQRKRQYNDKASSLLNFDLWLNFLRPYVPSTFRHCRKSRLGLNRKNADAALRMMFSSDDDELYARFRGGYDDARRFLDERGGLTVYNG